MATGLRPFALPHPDSPCSYHQRGRRQAAIPDVWTIRAGVSFGMFRPTTERSEMSEETLFWGLTVERYGQEGRPTNALLDSTGRTPGNKPFWVYRVFSSRERADRFVQEQWQTLSQGLIQQTVANIRRIRRDEIPAEHHVSLDGNDPVTWATLLARG
jgi:hypothetical protein